MYFIKIYFNFSTFVFKSKELGAFIKIFANMLKYPITPQIIIIQIYFSVIFIN